MPKTDARALDPDPLAPAFLTRALRASGALPDGAVTSVRVEPLDPDASYNAQIVRLRLRYDLPNHAPRSLVAKLPTEDTALQANAAVFRPGTKECWFYTHGAAHTPVDLPACHYAEVDPGTGESVLILQDLAPARPGSWADGATPQQTALALRAAARLHAAWWMRENDLAHLAAQGDEAQALVERLYAAAWPEFLQATPVEVPDPVRRFGEHLVGRVAEAEATLAESPHTLVHGDFRVDNMLFGQRDGRPACWLIDWEDILLGNPMLDLAWFLGGCLPVERGDEEQSLLRSYHQALVAHGVAGYPWAHCLRDYRCAMVSCFVQGVLSALPPEEDDPGARRLSRAIGDRFVAACQRLRLETILDS